MSKDEELTQKFSSFGDKLLQHPDRLSEIQKGVWRPINVQVSLTSACGLNCEFCSVKNRKRGVEINFDDLKKGLTEFKELGAKAVEITGGGDPLLYSKINEIIEFIYSLGLEIGIITNNKEPERFVKKENLEKLNWIRISLSSLDFGAEAKDFFIDDIPKGKLGFSYIVNSKTSEYTFQEIDKLIRPDVKFVRIAPDCLDEKAMKGIKRKWGKFVEKYDKMFIKEISDNFKPYPYFCGVGAIRPYVVENGNIYICTSYVLQTRNYDDKYKIGEIKDVKGMYERLNKEMYKIDIENCWHCFYYNNNQILHSVIKELPERNFV